MSELPDFALEKIFRPYFENEGYFFAEQDYKIKEIVFKIDKSNARWEVKIESEGVVEKVDVFMDKILVFIFENKLNQNAK